MPIDIKPVDTTGLPESDAWKIVRYMVHACHSNGKPDFWKEITIEFDIALRTTAGTANRGTKTIKINRRLWHRCPEKEKMDTIIHEVCHLLTTGPWHGREWKDAMRNCGIEPKRCHTVDTTGLRNKRSRWIYDL